MAQASAEESDVLVFNLPLPILDVLVALCNELLDQRRRTPQAWHLGVASAKKQLLQQQQFRAFPQSLQNSIAWQPVSYLQTIPAETIFADSFVNWIFLDPVVPPIQLVPKEMAELEQLG